MPVAYRTQDQKPFVQVIKTEEKGSDVNLATHMMMDAFDNSYDCAAVISGDSDLKAPVQFVKNRFKKAVGVLNPQKKPCKALQSIATFYKHIHEPALQGSQFPPLLTDKIGTFHKPEDW